MLKTALSRDKGLGFLFVCVCARARAQALEFSGKESHLRLALVSSGRDWPPWKQGTCFQN